MLETGVDEIQAAGKVAIPIHRRSNAEGVTAVEQASKARQKSFSSANPLALGSGNKSSRNVSIPTPLGWLAGRFSTGGTR